MQVSNLGYFMRHKTLGGKFLAFVRLLISEQEQCIYCVNANSGILLQYGVLPEVISEVKMDPSKAPLEKNEVALLLFVLKLVKDANSITQDDVDSLRNLGWTDSDILEASYHGTSQVGADKLFNAFKIENDF
jgi:alkylhydroperoxidase family enzyme